jgi:hypothetical protein
MIYNYKLTDNNTVSKIVDQIFNKEKDLKNGYIGICCQKSKLKFETFEHYVEVPQQYIEAIKIPSKGISFNLYQYKENDFNIGFFKSFVEIIINNL